MSNLEKLARDYQKSDISKSLYEGEKVDSEPNQIYAYLISLLSELKET